MSIMLQPLLLGAALSGLASSACLRADLQQTLDGFFHSAFARHSGTSQQLPALAKNVRITQNNVILKSLEDTAWKNSTSFFKKWQITVIDTDVCEVASYRILKQRGAGQNQVPSIMGIRIKRDTAQNVIQELEIVNLLDGGPGILAKMFQPANDETYSDTTEEFWNSPQNATLSRTELIKVANSYPDGIQAGDGKNIPIGDACPRWENGVQTAGGSKPFKNTTQPRYCRDSLDEFKQPVEHRRWLADTKTGAVLGMFYFSHRKSPLVDAFDKEWGNWLNEFFKVQNGKMVGVHAIMLFVRDKKVISDGVSKSQWVPAWS